MYIYIYISIYLSVYLDGMSPDKQRGSGSIDKPDEDRQKKAAGGGAGFNPFGAIG